MQGPLLLLTDSATGQPIAGAEQVLEDSVLVRNYLPNAQQLFCDLDATAPWTDPTSAELRYRGHELPRQKAFWTRGGLRRYRYPGWQWASMLHYDQHTERIPSLHALVEELEQRLLYQGQPVVLNHIIATRYRDATDCISYHSDKMHDIAPGTPIISMSLGESREFHLGRPDPADPKKTLFERAIVLGAGDLFVLGPRTNAAHRHAIVPVSDERVLERDVGAAIQPRISLVFRNIATQVTLDNVRAKIAQKKRAADGDASVKKPRPTRRHKPGQE